MIGRKFLSAKRAEASEKAIIDLKDFFNKIILAKHRPVGPALSKLISTEHLNQIYDALFTQPYAIISTLKPGQSIRFPKEWTGLARTFNVLRVESGEFQLILETKSKLKDGAKRKLPKIGGKVKSGKPSWRVDNGEQEYFNLVVELTSADDFKDILKEVAISKKMAAKEVNSNDLSQPFFSKGKKKISVYSVKAEGDLNSLLEKRKKGFSHFTLTQQNAMILDLLRGVKKFHDSNYVHQDLKPGNILYFGNSTDGYQLKLTDFGLSNKENANSAALATQGYQSPEISYYHSDPKAYNHKYYMNAGGLGDKFFKEHPEFFPTDGSLRPYNKTPNKANDMWALGMIIFEIRHLRQPRNHFDLWLISQDPLLKGLLTFDRTKRLTIDQAMEIHLRQMAQTALMMPTTPPPTSVWDESANILSSMFVIGCRDAKRKLCEPTGFEPVLKKPMKAF